MLTMASCSSGDDGLSGPETPQTANNTENNTTPVSWLTRATTSEELKQVEDAISAIRGAGYTYRDNESYCVGTDMEVFNMRKLRDIERKYNTSYIVDDYIPASEQKFYYSESTKALKDSLGLDIGIGVNAGAFSVDVDVAFNKKNFSTTKNYYSLMRLKQSYFSRGFSVGQYFPQR